MDGTGSGSCPLVGFGIADVETSGSATNASVVFWRQVVEMTDGTGSGSCPLVGFGIDDVEPLGSATKASVLFWTPRLWR